MTYQSKSEQIERHEERANIKERTKKTELKTIKHL